MHARVATFEVQRPRPGQGDGAEIKSRSSRGHRSVPAVGFLLLHKDDGKVLAISLFRGEGGTSQPGSRR